MKVSNACFDMMVDWVLSEKGHGRLYPSMAQAIPAFVSYLTGIGWTEEQAQKIASAV